MATRISAEMIEGLISGDASIKDIVLRLIESSYEIYKELNLEKEWIDQIIPNLRQNSFFEIEIEESRIRPSFVGFQAITEKILVLLIQKKVNVLGAIHTTLPATPVCVEESNTNDIIHESLQDNQGIVYTVKSRSIIIREYLETGKTLRIIYFNGKKDQRSQDQLRIFEELKNKYPNLSDIGLNEDMPEQLNGATYLIRDYSGNDYLFAINSRQVAFSSEKKVWRLIFGSINDDYVRNYYNELKSFIDEHSKERLLEFPDLIQENVIGSQQEIIELKPDEHKEEVVESKPAEHKEETIESKPEEHKEEVVESRPAEHKEETIESKPAEHKEETIESKPEEHKEEAVESKPAEHKEETIESKSQEHKQESSELKAEEAKEDKPSVQKEEEVKKEIPQSGEPESKGAKPDETETEIKDKQEKS